MHKSLENLDMRIAAQRELIPAVYGQVDFSSLPERFTQSLDEESSLPCSLARLRAELLADHDRVALIRAYTMLGDNVADAPTALFGLSTAGGAAAQWRQVAAAPRVRRPQVRVETEVTCWPEACRSRPHGRRVVHRRLGPGPQPAPSRAHGAA